MQQLNIALAQLDLNLGDIRGNADKMLRFAEKAKKEFNADIIVYPELALTDYPPEDLLLRNELHQRVEKTLKEICDKNLDICLIIGHPTKTPHGIFNSVSVIHDGKILKRYDKQLLPNYSVFDEKRYFQPGHHPCVFELKGVPIGIVICEDLWHPGPVVQAAKEGAKILLSPNASPFHRNKPSHRIDVLRKRVSECNLPIVYVNSVGAQDELVFDGGSFVIDREGVVQQQSPLYEESLSCVTAIYDQTKKTITVEPGKKSVLPSEIESIYKALVLGTRDYLQKNKMQGALIGLSGGIDSALTLAIAVDAIGAENVHAVLMPSRYTHEMSNEDAITLAQNLKVNYSVISIEPMFEAFLTSLQNEFKNLPQDVTEENIQSRCRGTLLMALSNKTKKMVLTTGNKSEMAVGYATLYGDMAGGYAVIKDVLKTTVYQLAHYRNQQSLVIPQRTIDRSPSAELSPNQLDTDTLPDYPILDRIIADYVEHDLSAKDIIAKGIDAHIVKKVINMIDRNEYKRRQSPPGVRISNRAFGRDWRYPITSGYEVFFE